MLEFLLAHFLFTKIPNIFSEFQNPLKNHVEHAQEFQNFWPLEKNLAKGGHQGAHPGAGRPHKSVNPGPMAPGPYLLQRVHVTFGLLNRGREGGCEAFILTLSLTPSHDSCSGFHWILAQVRFQEIFLSHFLAARIITHLEEQLSGKDFIFC